MSFALTTEQVRARTKDVTRRLGWTFLKSGDLIQAVVKCQGLKKGEHVEPIARLFTIGVRREILRTISNDDVRREGFPGLTREEFITMFCRTHKGCTPNTEVTRIHFMYAPSPAAREGTGA